MIFFLTTKCISSYLLFTIYEITFLENLQLHTSSQVSDLDQQKTDWKHFWDKIKIDLGLKEKKPELHIIQAKKSS